MSFIHQNWNCFYHVAIRAAPDILHRLPDWVLPWTESYPYPQNISFRWGMEGGLVKRFQDYFRTMSYKPEAEDDNSHKAVGCFRASEYTMFLHFLMFLVSKEPQAAFAIKVDFTRMVSQFDSEDFQGLYYSRENDTALYVRAPNGDQVLRTLEDCIPTPPRYVVEITDAEDGVRGQYPFQECVFLDDTEVDFMIYDEKRALMDVLNEAIAKENAEGDDLQDPVIITAYPPFPEDILAWHPLIGHRTLPIF